MYGNIIRKGKSRTEGETFAEAIFMNPSLRDTYKGYVSYMIPWGLNPLPR